VAIVLAANALYLLHVFDANPIGQISALGTRTTPGVFPGGPVIDPNIGNTAQSLGHRVAADWFSGHVPWWNPFEGVGAPLAGEMQSAAFFPPSLLLWFSGGQLYLHILLEITAGLATFGLLRRITRSRWPATVGGALFALNGTFAWLGHAPVNPIAFLPLTLLGVEYAVTTAARGSKDGWMVLSLAVVLSLIAGFPEVAFIDGLVAVGWVVVRGAHLRGAALSAYARKVAAGVTAGLALAAPVLVAFADYLPNANVGAHSGGYALASFPGASVPQFILPYVYGPIFGFGSADPSGVISRYWEIGFVTTTLVTLAAIGLGGRHLRALRVLLGSWIVLAVGKTLGIGIITHLLNLVPGVPRTAFYVYATVSWEFAVIALATMGIDDVVTGHARRWWVMGAATAVAVATLVAVHRAYQLVDGLYGAPHARAWALASSLWGIGMVVVVGVLCMWRRGRLQLVTLSVMVVAESMAMFVVPQLSAPRAASLDTRPVAFLASNLGLQRFMTYGPIQPEYGSYFGLAEVDVNDLPVPKLYTTYITSHLDPGANPLVFNGVQASPKGPTALDALASHLAGYRAIGVKYVVLPAGSNLGGDPRLGALRLVYRDPPLAAVYELADAAPYFEATGGACQLRVIDREHLRATCPAQTQLVRRELWMPGWTATVAGQPVAVRQTLGIFQGIALPAGTSTATFTFTPPHMAMAELAGVGALLVLAGRGSARLRRRHRTTARRAAGARLASGDPVVPSIRG
jgi:hypothetical protein